MDSIESGPIGTGPTRHDFTQACLPCPPEIFCHAGEWEPD